MKKKRAEKKMVINGFSVVTYTYNVKVQFHCGDKVLYSVCVCRLLLTS